MTDKQKPSSPEIDSSVLLKMISNCDDVKTTSKKAPLPRIRNVFNCNRPIPTDRDGLVCWSKKQYDSPKLARQKGVRVYRCTVCFFLASCYR